MPEDLTTARLALPLLAAGQAQKEVTHNEALALIDLAVTPLVEAVGLNGAPPSPGTGQQWIVGSTPDGAWLGQAGSVAGWTGAGWRFVQLPVGAVVTEGATMRRWRRNSTTWVAPASVAAVSGGATVDSECRAQMGALISALVAQGLLTG